MTFSHKLCDHPATPAGRKACRTSGVAATVKTAVARIDSHGMTTQEAARNARENKNRADAAAGRMARRPSRLAGQNHPDVREAIRNCVQAELHTGPGRCACGWSS